MKHELFWLAFRRVKAFLFSPRLSVSNIEYPLVRLGSRYGGWTFADTRGLKGGTVVSAGVGEDISFDVELLNYLDCKIFLVDPTPTALSYIQEVNGQIGKPKSEPYSSDGKQPIGSYDLTKINERNFVLVPQALWIHNQGVNLFPPRNPRHVSYSISNLQNRNTFSQDNIFVASTTLQALMMNHDIERLHLLKLDIEGSEVEVIENILICNIYPNQILVEYDEILFPSSSSKSRVLRCHKLLEEHGYTLIHRDPPSNFLYMFMPQSESDQYS